MIIIQQDPLPAELLLDNLVLRSQIVDHLLLLAIDPTSQDDQQQLPRL